MKREDLCAQLLEELASFSISCSPEQAELLVEHLLLVIEKNKVLNLTRITEPSEAVTLHIVDSLLPLAVDGLWIDDERFYLDMGTGAGFPGVPLAVVTGWKGILVDSVGKKVAAVNEFLSQMCLEGVSARHARVEELAREIPSTQDYVFARAVAQTNVLIEYAAPFLKQHGRLVVEKGRPSSEELSAARVAAGLCGFTLVSQTPFELPRGLGHREVLVFEKTRRPKLKLPRRVGMAKNEPLGV